MQFEHLLFLYQWLIFWTQCNFVIVKAISGENVRRAREGEFPFIVSITHSTETRRHRVYTYHICTGALITRLHVLTAAHCFEGLSKNEMSVVAGSTNVSCGMSYDILWWITYNEWANHRQIQLQFRVNDVSIVKLCEEVLDTIIPGVLTNSSNQHYYGRNAIMSGWSVSDGRHNRNIMQAVDVRILSKTDCEAKVARVHGTRVPVPERLLCSTTNPYAFMDHGDSGGPLLSQNRIIGVNQAIVPIGHPEPHPDKVNVHSGIEFYKNFYLDAIRNDFVWA